MNNSSNVSPPLPTMAFTQQLAITIVGLIWSGAGCYLLTAGWLGLSGEIIKNPSTTWLYIAVCGLVGLLKGVFVLRRSAERSFSNLASITPAPLNLFVGWLKLLSWRGILLIALMMGLGVLLGNWLESFNPAYRGLLRLTIGVGLLTGSSAFWGRLRK